MYWQDSDKPDQYTVPDDVVDLAFAIRARSLPVEHAWALSQAVLAVLPWIGDEPAAGVHAIHVAESGNGWMRPEGANEVLYPSRRTRLVIRVPRHRIDDGRALTGRALDVKGHTVAVEQADIRPLVAVPAVFSRYVVVGNEDDENRFLSAAAGTLRAMGVTPRKMLCGMPHRIETPTGTVLTRSLMLADLPPEEAVRLQQTGLGPHRAMGCGLFIPHKDIKEVKQALD